MKIIFTVLFSILIFCLSLFADDSKTIRSAETVSGIISLESASDNWSFYGEAGQRVLIYAIKISGTMSSVDIKLFDKDMLLEYQNNRNSDIDYQLKKTGLYTIKVEAKGQSGTGTYSLTFLKIPGAVTSPNDMDGGNIFPGTKKLAIFRLSLILTHINFMA